MVGIQATKVDLKEKTELLSTMERQRVQYEAMAKSKQQVWLPDEVCVNYLIWRDGNFLVLQAPVEDVD